MSTNTNEVLQFIEDLKTRVLKIDEDFMFDAMIGRLKWYGFDINNLHIYMDKSMRVIIEMTLDGLYESVMDNPQSYEDLV